MTEHHRDISATVLLLQQYSTLIAAAMKVSGSSHVEIESLEKHTAGFTNALRISSIAVNLITQCARDLCASGSPLRGKTRVGMNAVSLRAVLQAGYITRIACKTTARLQMRVNANIAGHSLGCDSAFFLQMQ
jgi:hypothetical protein